MNLKTRNQQLEDKKNLKLKFRNQNVETRSQIADTTRWKLEVRNLGREARNDKLKARN